MEKTGLCDTHPEKTGLRDTQMDGQTIQWTDGRTKSAYLVFHYGGTQTQVQQESVLSLYQFANFKSFVTMAKKK